MARISSYTSDTNVVGNDRWPGSDWQTPDKITKNFTADAVASYFNKSAIIDTGQFSWEFLPYNNTQPQPEKTFMKVDWLDDTININNLAGVLRVSALTLGNTQPGAFIENEWVGNNILIHLPNSPSAYAIYTVDSLVPDGDWYYLMNLSYVGGQSFTILKNEPVVMGYFAGANVITEITGTFPIIVSEGSIPDVSIDPTVKGEWDLAYDNSIVSAAVTGTSTKTLTLTQQDGGTITASWTDEDTNLVTSVFGRTGAVVAVSGDYNTSQVTESTNLYFTQARAIASPITGYNPTLGTITATDTILTAINKLAGSYVPYTGATNNVNLGEKGITAGYVGFDLTPTGTPTAVGTMYWDAANRTVALVDGDGDTTLQIGQEERILVHNNTGSTLTDGQLVYVTGSTGNLPSVALASAATESTSAATIGMITETILNGADGFITVSGIVNGLNTLAFNEGDLLWLSDTPGGFTTTKPISPSHLVLIGYVIKKAGGNGSVLVKIQNTQELSESSDVLISAPEIDGQGLFLQTISGVQLWRNRSIVDVLGYTPADEATTLTINGTTYDLSANRTWSVGTVTSIAVGLGTSGTDVNVSGSPITSSGTITLNIPSASSVNRGLLTPTDWSTFNNKQDAGNYITSLTGEATASGPGAAAVTLSTPAVTGKLLTGVNITGGTVVATDTILEAFGKVQNQINGLVGGSIYKGTWNAATNTPTITSGVGNTGWYYIVSVSGSTNIDGITDWNLGDWIIFDGTAWQQVDNTDAVVSVNGYTGAVSLVSSDVPEGLTNLYFTNARARGAVSLTTTGSSGAATYNSDSGVFNIPNYGTALANYLPLTGGTLTGGLYINPTNTATVGLDVASNTVTFRSDNLEGFKRQLTTTMGSGTLVKMQAAGYGGTYVTDLGFYTSSSSAVNTTPNLYLTGGDNRVGINTVTPAYTLDVVGTAGVSGVLTLGSIISNGTYNYTLPSASGTLALTSDIPTGTITGSGTTNYVPKFTSDSAIANSNIQDSGTLITLGSNTTISSGGLGIGTPTVGGSSGNINIAKAITGGVSSNSIQNQGQIQSDVTLQAYYYRSSANTQATTFTIGTIGHYLAQQAVFGTGSTVSNQVGFWANSSLIGATNNYGFRGSIPSGTGRWNIYMDGTANNYLAGSLGIGTTTLTNIVVNAGKTFTGSSIGVGYNLSSTINSDVTVAATGYQTSFSTQATTFTLNELRHFQATQGTFGAGSTITNQYGYWVSNQLTGATNNYGFYGQIPSAANRWNIYMVGTAPNYLAGNLLIGSTADTGEKLQVTGTAKFTNRVVVDTDLVTNNVMFLKNANSNGYGLSIQAGFGTNYALYVANNVGAKAFEVLASGVTNVMGALNGTSATFSGEIQTTQGIYINRASLPYIQFAQSGTAFGQVRGNGTTFGLTDANGTTYYLGLNASSGAATFSSSVTAGGEIGISGNAAMVLNSISGSTSQQLQYRNNGTNKWQIYLETSNNSLNFFNSTNSTNRVTFLESGNVGIGTTAPGYKLAISSSANGDGVFYTDGTVGTWLGSLSSVATVGSTTNHPLAVYTNGAERMRITSAGNVGIGTTTPGTTRLAVNGDMSASRHFTAYGSASAASSTWVNLYQLPTNCNYSLLIHVREPQTYSNYTTIAWIYNYYNGASNLPAIASYVLNQSTSLQISGGYIQGRQASGSTATIYWDVTIFGTTDLAY